MTSQRPTRFENYPPEPDPAASMSGEGGPTSRVQPYLPPPVLRPLPPASGTSRRTVVGLAVGVPIAAVLGISVLGSIARSDESTGSATASADDAYDVSAEVGAYGTGLADGWVVLESREDWLELGNGTNHLYAIPQVLSSSTVAVDELPLLAKQALADIPGFRGTPGTAMDSSNPDTQKASLAGTGTFRGSPARLLANLWLTSSGDGLLVLRVLTAEPNSEEVYGAQDMTDQLSAGF